MKRQKSKLTRRIKSRVGQDYVVWRTFLASVKRGSYVIRGQVRRKFENKRKFLKEVG